MHIYIYIICKFILALIFFLDFGFFNFYFLYMCTCINF